MNPAFWLLVIIGAVVLWFLSAYIFIPLGKAGYKLYSNAIEKMNKTEEKEKIKNDKR